MEQHIDLTAEDSKAIETLAEQANVTTTQLIRYVLRRFINEKLKENPSLVGG